MGRRLVMPAIRGVLLRPSYVRAMTAVMRKPASNYRDKDTGLRIEGSHTE